MRKTLILEGLEPISVNSMHNRGQPRLGKSADAQEWTYHVFHELNRPENQAALEELRSTFSESKHALHLELTAHYPKSILYNKSGTLSARAIDISNWEKPLIDLLCLPKYFDRTVPEGCKNLCIDDRFVQSMLSRKLASEHAPRLEITIEILNINI